MKKTNVLPVMAAAWCGKDMTDYRECKYQVNYKQTVWSDHHGQQELDSRSNKETRSPEKDAQGEEGTEDTRL